MGEAGLSEAILRQHHGPYPATQKDNRHDCPIDGIFVTDGVRVCAGGYLDFEQYFPSNHRALWIDIHLPSMLGVVKTSKSSFAPRRLTSTDGRSAYI
mmetsp:Transcript_23158/g.57136  ORF Transcript_23158/g.57136 Transcript_23158/m.57136 type:complete len:97 (-) Transcript_23158:853-1143(-)